MEFLKMDLKRKSGLIEKHEDLEMAIPLGREEWSQ